MSAGIQIVRMLVESVFGAILHKVDKQQPIKGYRKTTTFTGRGGAWFIIGICVFCIVTMVWTIVTDRIIHNDWWAIGIVLLAACTIYFIFLLRYSISMLKAKIIVGPETLVLDGATEVHHGHGFKHWLREEFINMTPSDLVVELPWSDIDHIIIEPQKYGLPAGMIVETNSHERFKMNIWYFDTKVVKEIKKYYPNTITR